MDKELKAVYKSMSYNQLSKEAVILIRSYGWFKSFEKLAFIYSEMKIKNGPST